MTPPPNHNHSDKCIPHPDNQSTPSSACAARRYRARDAHVVFFRPRSKATTTNRKPKKQVKVKQKPWTNKQRTAWDHTHFIIHQGSTTEVTRFLILSKNHATTVSPEVFNQIFQMSANAQPQTTSTTTSPPGKWTHPTTITPSRSLPRPTLQ